MPGEPMAYPNPTMSSSSADGDSRRSEPASLARMIDLEDSTTREWRDAEVEAMLRHQLNAPVATELKLSPAARDELTRAPITSFADLLTKSDAPLWALEETKQFAKSNLSQIDGPLKGIATLLYYASIAAALVHQATRISDLNDQQLGDGFAWAMNQPWLSTAAEIRALLERAAASVGC
jgi:hypothetical protein